MAALYMMLANPSVKEWLGVQRLSGIDWFKQITDSP